MLQAEHLSYNITEEGRQSEILTDVSFTVEDGEMLVITGPNGGGKSTLAKLLMGINEATGGKIILDGQDITSYTIDKRAQAGMGFEQIHKEKKQSLILISHQERIIRMADRIMVIGDGKVEAVGTADEIVPILFGKKPESCGCRIQKGGELYER